jgi:hypothetical protein
MNNKQKIKGFDSKLVLEEKDYPDFQGRVWFEPRQGKRLKKSLDHQYSGCACLQTTIDYEPKALPETVCRWFNEEFWYSFSHQHNGFIPHKMGEKLNQKKLITFQQACDEISTEVSRLLNNAEVKINPEDLEEAWTKATINGVEGYLIWNNCD